MAFRKTGKWQKQLLGDELSEKHRATRARVTLLSVRVRDESVRNLARDLQDNCAAIAMCASEADNTRLLQIMMGMFDKSNERIGELLREMDKADR
jgi:hypothetical protein